jgi:hypothetical protein
MPVKLRLTQPLVVDAKGKSWSEVWDSAVEQARKQNADGVVMKNVQDWGDTESAQEAMSGVDRLMKRNQPLRTVYAVFDPSNIRSTNAAFDPAKSSSANILATPPELGGAFVGGALGGTQGETPEERARNALLGAAGGAVGGRMARGMTPDRTRMGSNLGNVPKPVQKAQAAGYEGQDIGEAKEWVAARSKGLDMSQAARMKRAKEQGFIVDSPLYHGTAATVESFDPTKFGRSTNARSARLGVWLTSSPHTAAGYAKLAAEDAPVSRILKLADDAERKGNFDEAEALTRAAEAKERDIAKNGGRGANIMPIYVRGRFKTVDMEGAKYDPTDTPLTELAQQAKKEGFDGLRLQNFSDEGGWGQYNPTDHVLVFNPSNIRSVNAAFDPASKESANILAGVGAVGAGAAMTGAIRPPEQKKTPGQRPRG